MTFNQNKVDPYVHEHLEHTVDDLPELTLPSPVRNLPPKVHSDLMVVHWLAAWAALLARENDQNYKLRGLTAYWLATL